LRGHEYACHGGVASGISARSPGAVGSHRLPSQYPRPVIGLGIIAGLHAYDHQLAAYCPRCDAWRVLPLGE